MVCSQWCSQPSLSGVAKWNNLPDFCLSFLIFPLFPNFSLFPDFFQNLFSFSQFLTFFFLSRGQSAPSLHLHWLCYSVQRRAYMHDVYVQLLQDLNSVVVESIPSESRSRSESWATESKTKTESSASESLL